MRFAMEELLNAYKKKNPAHDIEVIYGSSGNFYAQIVNGAPYDLFSSADAFYPQKLYEAGQTWDEIRLYAIGQLALWSSTIKVKLLRDELVVLFGESGAGKTTLLRMIAGLTSPD
jgi:molybdate transport system substrate-binding protein